MENIIDYDDLKERLDKARDAEEKRFNEAKRQRNVAAFVDFASNLLSFAAYKKGARYSIGTSHLSKQQPLYLQAKAGYDRAMNDYNGKIAELNLFKSAKPGKGYANAALRPIAFVGNGTRGQARALTAGTFESAIKDFKSTYNRKNYSL